MKFGIRKFSPSKRIAARTSWKRVVRHNMGFKAPRGYGWITNPKRAAYNRVYNRTTVSSDKFIGLGIGLLIMVIIAIFSGIFSLFNSKKEPNLETGEGVLCPRCYSPMILRNGKRGQFYGCSRFPRCRGTRDFISASTIPLEQVSLSEPSSETNEKTIDL